MDENLRLGNKSDKWIIIFITIALISFVTFVAFNVDELIELIHGVG